MEHDATLPWTDDQWAMLQKLVQDTARKVRVAAGFLPLVGPLPPGQQYVPRQTMTAGPVPASDARYAENRLEVGGYHTDPLITISCSLYFSSGEVKDPELAAGRQMIIRAASVLGRLEDEILFNGAKFPSTRDPDRWGRLDGDDFATSPSIFALHGDKDGSGYPGLLLPPMRAPLLVGVRLPPPGHPPPPPGSHVPDAESLVVQIAAAIQTLEVDGHFGPFACVLGRSLYVAAVTPTALMVMPSDRLTSLLGGGVLVPSVNIGVDQGLVIALGGSVIDLAIGADLSLSYVGRTTEPRYVLELSQSFRLRVHDATGRGPVQQLHFP